MRSKLRINNKDCNIVSSNIKCTNATYNTKKGFSFVVEIDIKENNEKGYISFFVDFFKDNNFKNLENKKYVELPSDLDSKIDMVEIYDTHNFIDLIDSYVTLLFGKIVDNKIETKFIIDDEQIKVEYEGMLDIYEE